MSFFSEEYEDLDTGTADQLTLAGDIQYVSSLFIEARQTAGNTDDCVLEIQCSTDNLNWMDSGITLSMVNGGAMMDNVGAKFKYIRIKVKTKSTIASTSIVCIQGK